MIIDASVALKWMAGYCGSIKERSVRFRIALVAFAVVSGCSASGDSTDGYLSIPVEKSVPVKKAVGIWRNCLIYGIGQVDDGKDSSVAIAEAALAGCVRAESNLEDRLFDAMKGHDDPREVRALAHDMMAGFRERMKSESIRLVLKKHAEERAKR